MSSNDLIRYIDRFENTPVLIIGDLMVDHYFWGKVSRISPEAPVPVVDVTRDTLQLGGAANVAHNIQTLGGKSLLCGVVGDDEKGRWLLQEMIHKQMPTEGIVIDPARLTTQKTRVIAHHQHVVRFDYEERGDIGDEVLQRALSQIQSLIQNVSIVVISDYAKGMIGAALLKEVRSLAGLYRVRILVDPKVNHFDYYKGVSMITPNTLEASRASGIDIRNEKDLLQSGEVLLRKADCEAILITRGEEGMSLFERGGPVTHIPSVAQDVFDVTGAGDTVISTLSLALASGISCQDAARLANYAAGVAVSSVGTTTVNRKQLMEAIRHHV